MADRNIPDGSDELVLIERTTPEAFREWMLAGTGGFEAIPRSIRDIMPAPEEWLKDMLDRMSPGDELWTCRSKIFNPGALIGNEGIAIVRDGKPIRYRAVRHY